jgi:hypothetical protein
MVFRPHLFTQRIAHGAAQVECLSAYNQKAKGPKLKIPITK